MRAWKQTILFIASFLLLAACSDNQEATTTINLGVNVGPEVGLAQQAAKLATKGDYGIRLKINVFSDYTEATLGLCEGKVDAAVEALPYVKQQFDDPNLRQLMKSMNCRPVLLTHTFIYSMGIYSRTISDLSQLPQQAVVAIPSPPLSAARALLALRDAGLIQLRPGVSTYATVSDITSNPHGLVIVPINPGQLSDSIAGATLVVISSSYANQAGAFAREALFTDSSPDYSMVIMVRDEDLQNPEFAELIGLYHSPELIKAAEKMTGNTAIPSWNNDASN